MNASGPSQSLRKAALAVHALAPVDRAWVLKALPVNQREEIEPLLAELRALGIPEERALTADLDVRPREPQLAWPDTLDPHTVAALSRTLHAEPERLTHMLLAIRGWSWASQLLGSIDEGRRTTLAQAAWGGPVAPRLASAVLEALRQRVTGEERAGFVAETVAPRAWQRLRAVLAPFGRRT